MSIVIATALSLAIPSAADAVAIGPGDWDQVSKTAQRLELPPQTLYTALTARERPRPAASVKRLCIRRSDIVAGKQGMVCRTRTQWAKLGIDIRAPHA